MRSCLFLLLTALRLTAATVSWDANPPSDSVTNYAVLIGTNSGLYLKAFYTGTNTTFRFSTTNLFSGTNYMAVVAVNSSGLQSDPSNEIQLVAPIGAPMNFRVKLSMDSAPSPTGPWTETLSLTNSVAVTDAAYFRGRLDIKPSDGLP